MEGIEIMSVSSITLVCYVVAMFLKTTALDNKWLPVICATLGGLLGIAGLYILPDFPAGDILNAISVGITSGLAATGANQVYKQLSQPTEEEDA